MKVLFIYDIIPEQTQVAIADIPVDVYNQLKVAHGYVVNASEHDEIKSDAANTIGWAFCTNTAYLPDVESDLARQLFGTFTDVYGTDDCSDISDVVALVHCGFYL